MKDKPTKISIDGIDYVRADNQITTNADGLAYVVVRSRDSGCHAGYLHNRDGATVHLFHARRLWYWVGASSLSQLAMEGVTAPNDCKFPCVVPEITVIGVCEIIPATSACKTSIESVPVWKQ